VPKRVTGQDKSVAQEKRSKNAPAAVSAKSEKSAKAEAPAKAEKSASAKLAKAEKPAPTAQPVKAGKSAKSEKSATAEKAVKPAAADVKPAAPKAAPKTAAAAAPTAVSKPAVADDEKKVAASAAVRPRRARTRLSSDGGPVAAWLNKGGDKPRASSFIPAPPRAEAPSLVAAAPASSDRLIRAEELTEFVVRTVPVRVDVEQGAGRFYLGVHPMDVTLKPGEGIEWDFRYIGGSDVVVDELIVEFERSPFPQTSFRSSRPGIARPHRQLSGPAQVEAAGAPLQYVIRAYNMFGTVLCVARPRVTIVP
jgi:hypothetical protein